MPNNFGQVEVLLYSCLQNCNGGNCSSQVCCLLELLQWFWLWKVRYTGEYSKDRGYGKNSSDTCCLKLKFSSNITLGFNTEVAGVIL